jgi:uncharacterized protein YndB with AHSA1/START domain
MLTFILIALAIIIVLFVIIVAAQPTDFRIARSISISAPATTVFEQVNDLHKWEAWSPWVKLDPTSNMTYDGPPAGVGASYTWSGNNKVGEGRSTITENRPSELVRLRIEFMKPFKATHTVDFTFKPEGGQTVTTWAMTGQNNFMAKAVTLFMNCDKMVGAQFELGLAQMKVIAEAAGK